MAHVSLQTLIAAARKEAQQQASGSGGSSSSGDVTIVNADVRALLQPQEEGLLLRPHPARASHYMQSVTPVEPPPKPCGNCGKYFHSLLRCKACQSVAYCGRDCQLAHWKAHKQQCKQVQQEKEAAAAAKADKAKRAQH
uniref:MYND-type domain-containing protein n=1 Tax=Tetradesmus obliquus TaxID=3088 RepID=A0A383V1W6_TETOB|eukprot:jgi/Sobl393_1/7789/SZX59557.1